MSIAKVSGAPVVRVVDGEGGGKETYTFPMLKRRDVAALIAKWAAEDRAVLVKTLEDAGADSAVKLDRLRDFDIESGTIQYGYRALFKIDRTFETVLTSLRVANPTATEDALDRLPFSPDELWAIAAELWGLRTKAGKDTEGDGEKKADGLPGSPESPGNSTTPSSETNTTATPTN